VSALVDEAAKDVGFYMKRAPLFQYTILNTGYGFSFDLPRYTDSHSPYHFVRTFGLGLKLRWWTSSSGPYPPPCNHRQLSYDRHNRMCELGYDRCNLGLPLVYIALT